MEILNKELKKSKSSLKTLIFMILVFVFIFGTIISMALLSGEDLNTVAMMIVLFLVFAFSYGVWSEVTNIKKMKHLLKCGTLIKNNSFEIKKYYGRWYLIVIYQGIDGRKYELKRMIFNMAKYKFYNYLDLIIDVQNPKEYFFIDIDLDESNSLVKSKLNIDKYKMTNKSINHERNMETIKNNLESFLYSFEENFDKFRNKFTSKLLATILCVIILLIGFITSYFIINYALSSGQENNEMLMAGAPFFVIGLSGFVSHIVYLVSISKTRIIKLIKNVYSKSYNKLLIKDKSQIKNAIELSQTLTMFSSFTMYNTVNFGIQIDEHTKIYDFYLGYNDSDRDTDYTNLKKWYLLMQIQREHVNSAPCINIKSVKRWKNEMSLLYPVKVFNELFLIYARENDAVEEFLTEEKLEKFIMLRKKYKIDFDISIGSKNVEVLISRKRIYDNLIKNSNFKDEMEFIKMKKYFVSELEFLAEAKEVLQEIIV